MSVAKENRKYHLFLFLISPIIGLFYGIKSKEKSYIRWSIFIFTVIYGSLFHESYLGDGAVHWEQVHTHYAYLDFNQFWDELMSIISLKPQQGTNDDPFIHVLSYFIGTILNAPRLFFVAVAIVYAYFYSGVMVKLLSYVDWNSKNNKFFFTFFLILLILWIPPLKMQTVRTWTGMWILLYAILSYHETKKTKYILLAFVPPLVHVGFFALAFPIWVVLLTGYRNPKIYFIIFVVSLLVSNVVDKVGFTDIASQTELGASKTSAYYIDDEIMENRNIRIEERASSARFYKNFERYNLHINVLTGLIIFIFVFLQNKGFGKIENALFSYGLAMGSFSNFFTQIYAVHNRGWEITAILILGLVVIFLSKQNFGNIRLAFLKIKLPFFVFIIAIVPYVFYLLSNMLSFTSPYIFILPIANWIDYDLATTIRGVIGLFL